MEDLNPTAVSTAPTATLTDGLSLWDAEAAPTPTATLSVLRLDANEKLLIPFTTSLVRAQLHYLDFPAFRGYVHCTGPNCVLCRSGRQPDVRDLWPVYDAVDRVVSVLPISPNLRPLALRPQLAPLLRQLKDRPTPPTLLGISRQDLGRFQVRTLPLPEGADDGAIIIRAFVEQLTAGTIDVAAVYPRLGAAELAAIPEVATMLQLRGISLS